MIWDFDHVFVRQPSRAGVKQLNDDMSTALWRLYGNCGLMTWYFDVAEVENAFGFQPSLKHLSSLLILIHNRTRSISICYA